ncbi:hypothetical protein C8Q80DRAFT_307239 [Daedaleopsis nitida]|nr:hypothetical protein C8Q80DRAFT_307239 [Daedaleopsis nitida]
MRVQVGSLSSITTLDARSISVPEHRDEWFAYRSVPYDRGPLTTFARFISFQFSLRRATRYIPIARLPSASRSRPNLVRWGKGVFIDQHQTGFPASKPSIQLNCLRTAYDSCPQYGARTTDSYQLIHDGLRQQVLAGYIHHNWPLLRLLEMDSPSADHVPWLEVPPPLAPLRHGFHPYTHDHASSVSSAWLRRVSCSLPTTPACLINTLDRWRIFPGSSPLSSPVHVSLSTESHADSLLIGTVTTHLLATCEASVVTRLGKASGRRPTALFSLVASGVSPTVGRRLGPVRSPSPCPRRLASLDLRPRLYARPLANITLLCPPLPVPIFFPRIASESVAASESGAHRPRLSWTTHPA